MAGTDWDAAAPTFDEQPDHGLADPVTREAWRRLLTGALPAPGRLADLGCGTGTLAALVAHEGWRVEALDVSPAMVARARDKTAGLAVTVRVGDAADPPLPPGGLDAVLCRHVLWALPDPAAVLRRWVRLLAPHGRLVLVEGRWHTGAGLTAADCVALLQEAGRPDARVTALTDPVYWGGPVADERYLVTA